MSGPVEYSITVTIERQTLVLLRQDKQKVLALVRDIGIGEHPENGNIVFATFTSEELAPTQTFTWVEQYAVHETETRFQDGEILKPGTDTEQVDILCGQTASFDENGHVTVTGNPALNLGVFNGWRNIVSVVLSGKSENPDGGEDITPYYISLPRLLGDMSKFTPVQSFSLLVSSSLKAKTKTMIDVTTVDTAGRFEINPGKTDCVVSYDTTIPGDEWKSVSNCTKLN